MYADLHNHLYGSISPGLLFHLGKKNPNPRWKLFIESYEACYGKKINPSSFFDEFQNPKNFEEIYLFREKAPFSHFQSKFNLIIALSKFDKQEIYEVARQVSKEQAEAKVSYGEYRIMISKEDTKAMYIDKLIAMAEGFLHAEQELGKDRNNAKIVVSLHRDGKFETHYDWIKDQMEKNSLLRESIVGLDFCYIEEGYPPKDKEFFFDLVLRDNKAYSRSALALLVHVGESFFDKTPITAVRWVKETADFGAHRLGHALVLGLPGDSFLGQMRLENAKEWSLTANYLHSIWEELRSFGALPSPKVLQIPVNEDKVEISWNNDLSKIHDAFRFYVLSHLAKKGVVIETCPTSNYLIGGLPNRSAHPVKVFFESGVPITIGTDDPGLLDTSMEREFEWAEKAGSSKIDLEKIKKDSFSYRSGLLSGREKGVD